MSDLLHDAQEHEQMALELSHYVERRMRGLIIFHAKFSAQIEQLKTEAMRLRKEYEELVTARATAERE